MRSPPRTTCSSSHGRAAEILRRDVAGSRVGITIDLVEIQPHTDVRGGCSPRRGCRTGSATAGTSIRCCAASTPPTWSSTTRPSLPSIADGDLEAIAAPLDFMGVNYYTRSVVARLGGGHRGHRPAGGRRADGDGLGGVPGRARTGCCVRLADEYEIPPLYITENGAAYVDGAAPRRERPRPGADRVPRAATSTRSRRRSRTASASTATSSGRCSTTSSGATATPSASGWSTSTTRRSSACRSRATAGTAT